MDADSARAKLLTQHSRIRGHLDRCKLLAHQLLAGGPVGLKLDVALAELRTDFIEHNATETSLVGPLLHGSPDWGAVLIDRMLEEHVAEHSAFWERMSGTVLEVAARIDDLVEELESHMDAEERTFLSPAVLRADVIASHKPA